jgi:hypothetical protein
MYESKLVLIVEPVVFAFVLTFGGIYGLSSIFLRTKGKGYGARRSSKSLAGVHNRTVTYPSTWHF